MLPYADAPPHRSLQLDEVKRFSSAGVHRISFQIFPSAANVRRAPTRLDTLLWNFTQMQFDASLRRRSAPQIFTA